MEDRSRQLFERLYENYLPIRSDDQIRHEPPILEFLMISLSLTLHVNECVWRSCSSDELMKGNLVSFLITGNYTNTSEMPPSKCMSHVGHLIRVI